MKLLDTATANGAGEARENTSYLQTVFCWGTFDGATVTLEASPNNSDWFTVLSLSEKAVKGVGLNARFLRGSVSGVGGATSVHLTLA